MEDTKKLDEATKSEELAERVELMDEQLDQASGGYYLSIIADAKRPDREVSDNKAAISAWTLGL